MFDIGFWELLVIGIVALVVLGPERLPSAVRSTAKTIRGIKSMANGVKQEVSQQLKVHELHEHLKQAEKHGLDSVPEDVRRSVAELKAAAQSVQQPYSNKTQNQETPSEKSNLEEQTQVSESSSSESKASTLDVADAESTSNTIHEKRVTNKTNDSTK